jgi:hypothetical protein
MNPCPISIIKHRPVQKYSFKLKRLEFKKYSLLFLANKIVKTSHAAVPLMEGLKVKSI